jgi:DNA-binding transcriptional ArsR family regulator
MRELRSVSDVDTLKALADPLRLAILAALMSRTQSEMRVMSVKELAEELGEPQTKLYRHVKQLEAAGLIRVAASRLVSGILEQRYQARQRDLMFGPGLLRDKAGAGESEPVAAAILDRFRDNFFGASRAGLLGSGEYPSEQAHRRPILVLTETRLSPAQAARIGLRLKELIDEVNATQSEDTTGVPVNLLIGYYSPLSPADPAVPADPPVSG